MCVLSVYKSLESSHTFLETMGGKRYLLINVTKKDGTQYWRSAIRGDPEINPPPPPQGRMRMNAAQEEQLRRRAGM